ncbi:hypothetical protein [Cochlodiniinecator piscidefendens]|uniref:hypothetical protein n=1 Tax=Cochlodiniinecator piscidefendens TaxID=2715756 RepID=UPI00140C9BC9|nr:hypothetical protein [Cochlodiniinecator piscidefendens]
MQYLRIASVATALSLSALPAMAGGSFFSLPHLTFPTTDTATQADTTPATLPITQTQK